MITSRGAARKRGWFWLALGAFPVTALAILVFAGSLGAAHEGNDSADVERDAMTALGQKDGECLAIANPMYVGVTPAEIDAAANAQRITGSGWAKGRFVGSAQELAASRGTTVAASGHNSAWTFKIDSSGQRSISEYLRIDLPSGRVAWQPGRTIATAPCP